MRSANGRSIAEFCSRQYQSRSCDLMRGIDLKACLHEQATSVASTKVTFVELAERLEMNRALLSRTCISAVLLFVLS